MKETKTLFFMLGIFFAVCACSKNDSEKAQQTDPLFGFWCDSDRNYMLGIHSDSIGFMIDEMDGIEFNVPYQKQDNNTLAFNIPDNGNGTLTQNPETLDITLVINFGEESQTYNIPAYDHLDIATTAPNIAETFLFDENMATVVDTLRSDTYLPIVDIQGPAFALLLPDGRKGWIDSGRINLVRSKLTPSFLEHQYGQDLEDLRGHHDRTEVYSFNKLDNGKIGVNFTRIFINGTPAQESYFLGELDGIHINVTHSTRDFDAWMKGDFSTATALDEPFEITLVDAIVFPYVRTKRRVFNQMQI
ncbi:MAG: hypothetical protein K2H22_00175 [Muribaculaceae bacterium]|nr:hypothetical protein [Muribaculaceae bacterium]